MPWLAAHQGGWPHWADPGSELEAVYRHLGYAEAPAPAPDGAPEDPAAEDAVDDAKSPPPPARPPRRRRSART